MASTTELTASQWQVADAIARQLILDNTDLNEFRKSISYLRAYQDRQNAGAEFISYLQTLAKQGGMIGHSQKTQGYYRNIERTCREHLSESLLTDANGLIFVLGWAARMMQYYKVQPVGEFTKPEILSERELAVKAAASGETFAVGQQLQATVTAIKKNKVTYELLGAIKLSQKEPKKSSKYQVDQVVTVEITKLKDDGSPGSVKGID